MSKRKRRGKLNWRSKKANKGRKPLGVKIFPPRGGGGWGGGEKNSYATLVDIAKHAVGEHGFSRRGADPGGQRKIAEGCSFPAGGFFCRGPVWRCFSAPYPRGYRARQSAKRIYLCDRRLCFILFIGEIPLLAPLPRWGLSSAYLYLYEYFR